MSNRLRGDEAMAVPSGSGGPRVHPSESAGPPHHPSESGGPPHHPSAERARRAVDLPLCQCLSCDACRASCTLQRSTGRLHPSRLVRMAALGLRERVIRSREIWYCVECHRCTAACPSAVTPAVHIRGWRDEAVRLGVVGLPALRHYEALCRQLHRARARLVAECALGNESADGMAAEWETLTTPLGPQPNEPARLDTSAATGEIGAALESALGVPAALAACMSCRECMTACPVAGDSSAYDPVRIFRMVRLGLVEELLTTPAIWLCLLCGRCTDACTQGVSGHRVLESLQELALRRGLVPSDLRERLRALDRALYPRFVAAVDRWRV